MELDPFIHRKTGERIEEKEMEEDRLVRGLDSVLFAPSTPEKLKKMNENTICSNGLQIPTNRTNPKK